MNSILINAVVMNNRMVLRGAKVNHECAGEPTPASCQTIPRTDRDVRLVNWRELRSCQYASPHTRRIS